MASTVASELVKGAREIKSLVDQHAANERKLRRLADALLTSTQDLEDIRSARKSHGIPESDRNLSSLENEFERALNACKKRIAPKKGIVAKLRGLFGVKDMMEEIEALQQQVQAAQMRYVVIELAAVPAYAQFQVNARLVDEVAGLQQIIHDRVETARNDPVKAEQLFGISEMSTAQKRKALRKASIDLIETRKEADLTPLLSARVQALENALHDKSHMLTTARLQPPENYDPKRYKPHRPDFADPVSQKEDALMEAITLIRFPKDPNSEMPAITWFHRALRLSEKLGDLGLQTEALQLARVCCSLVQTLEKNFPEVFQPDFAIALNNLSIRLTDAGDYEGALKAIQEAVRIRRVLANTSPESYHPYLAISLNTLSSALANFGRHEEALGAIEEAVGITQALAKVDPATYNPDLALTLANLSNCMRDVCRDDESIPHIQQAIGIYRTLVQKDPHVYTPFLATCLMDLSLGLSDNGEHKEAILAIEESVKIYREFEGRNADAFKPVLARSLNNLAYCLSESGRYIDALVPIKEAIDILRHLALSQPAAYEPDLGSSLETYSSILEKSGKRAKAFDVAKEAVNTLQKYIQICPGKIETDLASSQARVASLQNSL